MRPLANNDPYFYYPNNTLDYQFNIYNNHFEISLQDSNQDVLKYLPNDKLGIKDIKVEFYDLDNDNYFTFSFDNAIIYQHAMLSLLINFITY